MEANMKKKVRLELAGAKSRRVSVLQMLMMAQQAEAAGEQSTLRRDSERETVLPIRDRVDTISNALIYESRQCENGLKVLTYRGQ